MLDVSRLPPQDELVRLLWSSSPDLAEARGRVGGAEADVVRSHLLPNPSLGLEAGTFAVGPTNPPGLNPFTETAHYSASVGMLFEVNKRGHRQHAAELSRDAARLEAVETLRQRYLDLLETIGRMAASVVRLSSLGDLVRDAERLTELQRARATHGESAGLEAARSELEEESLRTQVAEETAHLREAQAACSQLVGRPCVPPSTREQAAAIVTQLRTPPESAPDVRDRPDLAALEATRDAADARLALAHAAAIPDPTISAGYTRDQLVLAGNQPNSVTVNVSLPLPFFDHGQADARAASADRTSAESRRQLLTAQAQRDVASLRAQLDDVRVRRERLETHAVPLARSVVEKMEAAVGAGGASLSDLLLARRSLGELILELTDLDARELDLAASLSRVTGAGPHALPEDLP